MKNVLRFLSVFLISLFITGSVTFNNYEYSFNSNNTKLSQSVRKIKNIAVFIEFNDSDDIVDRHLDDEESVRNAYTVYNSDELFEMKIRNGVTLVPSFKRFYKEQSYGELLIETDIFPKVNDSVTSYRDAHPYAYYLKKTSSNPLGYSNYEERANRENELINNALSSIKDELERVISSKEILDSDNNGYIDAISFIVEIPDMHSEIKQGDLLWSHKATATNVDTQIFDKGVSSYNLISAADYKDIAGLFSLNQGGYGTLMHEFAHTLGFSDLYTDYASQTAPVGFYDLMGNYPSSNPPGFLTYFISDYRNYNNWHNKLETISSTTKDVTLTKPEYLDKDEKRAVIIKGGSKDEFFVVEYISKRDTYENYTVDKSGIIVYRIKSDESDTSKLIYIFRPNETKLGECKGDLTQATLHMGRNVFGKSISNDNTFDNETIHYSDGSNSGIIINVTGETDSSVTFDVEFPNVIGDGTKTNPYLINSVDDYLYYMSSSYATGSYYFKLMNDLDFSNVDNYPKIEFSGCFDGNNHVIKNIKSIGTGVFDSLGYGVLNTNNTVVRNLIIENINVTPGSGSYLGGLANAAMNSLITNVKIVGGSITNERGSYLLSTGGLLGTGYSSVSVSNCSVDAFVSSPSSIGGLIGLNQNISISDSIFNGMVSGESNVGMIIGEQYISEGTYKIPNRVYYEYKNDEQKKFPAVGGISYIYDSDLLSKDNLAVGISEMISIKSIEIDEYEVTIKRGESLTLKAQVLPANTTMDKTLSWKVENQEIASVQNGVVVGKKAGRTNAIVSSINGVSKSVSIVVIDPVIPIEKVIIDKSNIELFEGDKISLSATVIPTNTTMDKRITWSSSNTSVATVNNGVITSIKDGTTTITAKSINGCLSSVQVVVKKKASSITEPELLRDLGLIKRNGYVFGFSPLTDVSVIKTKISSFSGVQLKYFNRNNLSINSGIIATGMKYGVLIDKVSYDYTIIIKGDVDKDGEIFPTDYVKVRNYIMGKADLDEEAKLAADIDGDGEIFATDYVRVRNYIMGNGSISQK